MKSIKNYFKRLLQIMSRKQDQALMLQGQSMARQIDITQQGKIRDHGFKVYSQWDEDGIIQYLIKKIPIADKSFIEFGVENYEESNTRFLLKNNDWRGLVIDGDRANVDYIRGDNIYWRYTLNAIHGFITAENINQLISEHVSTTDVGILSIDIDGNDFWIWKNIDCIKPRIVIVEFNNLFGKDLAVTVPYKADFYRTKEHYSNLYFGCSLKALVHLAKEKGYFFVGCNSRCMNAFFVRNDLKPYISEARIEDEFEPATYRESKFPNGELSFLSDRAEQLRLIKDKILFDVESMQERSVASLF